ncbi:MAG: hypothetical protein K2N56_03270 [Oscillospiraceae bacterium]|nr:hypothetical protein [Oscillospiraceae bacterium]
MTKNEFLDIIGEIDGGLVESTFDPIQPDGEYTGAERPTVLRPDERKRPGVLKIMICAAACAAAAFAALVVMKNYSGITVSLPNETNEASKANGSIANIISDIASDTETSDTFEPEYFFDCVRVTPEYLEHTDQSVIKVKVELQDNIDSIREAYDKEYEGVEIDPLNSPWVHFLSAAMESYLREFMDDHGIDYDELNELGNVYSLLPIFTCELEKDDIIQLLNDERVFVIYIPNEDQYIVDCDF